MTLRILGPLWALGLLIFFLWVSKKNFKTEGIRYPILWMIGITLLVRMIPAFILQPGSNYDINSFQLVANNVRDFKDVFSAVDTAERHPYLPLQLYWIGLAGWLADKTGLAFSSVVRIAPIIADCFVVLLLFKMISKNKNLDPIHAAMLYAINPISVYVSAFHGQFDSIPLFFLLVSLFYAGASAYKSGFWLGLGIWIKSWPVLLLPIILNTFKGLKEKSRFVIAMITTPLVGIFIYLFLFQADFFNIVDKALGYNHGVGIWGYTYLVKNLAGFLLPELSIWSLLKFSRYLTIVILGLVWFFFARKQSPIAGVLTFLLAFFVITHAFSIQYLVWLIPLGVLVGDIHWINWFTTAAFAYMFLAYHTLILDMTITNIMPWPLADTWIIIPASLPVWIVTIFWFVNRINKHKFCKEIIK